MIAGIAAQAAIAMDNAHFSSRPEGTGGTQAIESGTAGAPIRISRFFSYSASHDLQEPLRTHPQYRRSLSNGIGDIGCRSGR